ncbi:MAG: DinB family protein, partial [Anaerolineales bacterium]
IIHITDSEANSYVRARRLLAEPGLALMAYDEMSWSVQLDYLRLNPVTALECFRWLRQSTYELIHDQPEAVWSQTAYHPESGDITLDDWLDIYARHVRDHIAQMDRVYESWLEAGS